MQEFETKPILKFEKAILGSLESLECMKAKRIFVRPNLYEALKHLRRNNQPIPLWVDALCINQANEKEKEQQVEKILEVYRKAARVCIWLGPGDTASDQAMSFVAKVIDIEKFDEVLNNEKYVQQWHSLFELLKARWFSRRWVIQELALAKDATVHCGTMDCNWADFKDAISIFHHYFKAIQPKPKNLEYSRNATRKLDPLGAKLLVDLTSNIFRIGPNDQRQPTRGLETLVSTLAGFETADPRDTIHALTSLSREKAYGDPTLPKPDYGKDLYEVYQNFVKWAVEHSGSLDIVCRPWALPERSSIPTGATTVPRLVTLPSWISLVDDAPFGRGADWFRGRRFGESFAGLPERKFYSASSREPPQIRFGEYVPGQYEDKSLYAKGFLIGNVEWKSEPIPDGVIPQRCLVKAGWTERAELGLEDIPDRLWRSLVADRRPHGADNPSWYRRACMYCLLNRTASGHINTEKILQANDLVDHQSLVQAYLERVQAVTWNRAFLEATPPESPDALDDGKKIPKLFGLGPGKVEVADVVVILYGCSVPVILRPQLPSVSGTTGSKGYSFIGEAYVCSKMDGEALYDGKSSNEMEFKIV